MSTHHLSKKVAAGFLVSLALIAAACGKDSASRMTSPSMMSANDASSSGTSSFTVLANAAVTCTNGTISGDVGTFQAAPTGSVTLTSCPVTGSTDIGDAAAISAYNAFVSNYNALAATPCDVMLTGTLAGVTLAPGVYCFDAAATLTGVLTLRGPSNGTWLFKIGTSGTGALTGTNFTVLMADGAQPCNVTWWVAQAATMTDSDFLGTILAGAAITLTRGTFDGNVYAGASGVGDVTITGTTVVGCAGSNDRGHDKDKGKCNQGLGNGPEGCDPGNSNNHNPTNDESGGTPGHPGRKLST
jgi:hypothetical protein